MIKQTLLKCLCSTFPVCLCSEEQLGVVLLEARASTQHHTAFSPLEFRFCFFVVTEHQWHQIQFPSKGQFVLNYAVSFFCLADGCGLSSHYVVWVWKSLPPSCIRSMTKACLNSQGDNFKHTEVRMTNLFKILRFRRWIDSFFVHLEVCLIMDWLLVMMSHLFTSPCVCYILVLQLVSAYCHSHHRNYPLLLDSSQSSAYLLHCGFPLPVSIIFILFHLNFIVFLKFFCSSVWFSLTLPQQFCPNHEVKNLSMSKLCPMFSVFV